MRSIDYFKHVILNITNLGKTEFNCENFPIFRYVTDDVMMSVNFVALLYKRILRCGKLKVGCKAAIT